MNETHEKTCCGIGIYARNYVADTFVCSFVFHSSFEVYERELIMGKLRWGPVHTERFWRENAIKFEKENFKLVRYVTANTDLIINTRPALYSISRVSSYVLVMHN